MIRFGVVRMREKELNVEGKDMKLGKWWDLQWAIILVLFLLLNKWIANRMSRISVREK